jgi:hypothetical protein
MMSPGRSIAVGVALFTVGGALVIARLSYVWQNGGQFWVPLGTAGVVVAAVGFVIMMTGWMMPKKDSSPEQIQIGGDRSTNIQAGRDITLPRDSRSGE